MDERANRAVERVAIVTGAGSGIGLEVARQLSARGFGLVLVGRTRGTLEAAGASLPGEWIAVDGDVGDLDFAQRLVEQSLGRFGGVDVLVNAAGVAALATIPNHTSAMIRESFDTNAIGPAALMARVWPIMVARGGGRIVNVSSMSSIDPFDGFFAYAASKAAMNMLSKVGDKEGKRSGVRVFCVAPGAVETAMLRSMFSKEQVPEKVTMSAAEVAATIVECAVGERDVQGGETIVAKR